MSVQRLALSNIIRNSPRLVSLPHHPVSSQNENEEESSSVTSRLVDGLIPIFNLLSSSTQTVHNAGLPSLFWCHPLSETFEASLKRVPNAITTEKLNKTSKTQCKTVEVSVQTDSTGDESSPKELDRLEELTWDLENKIGEELMDSGLKSEAVLRFKNASKHGNIEALYNYADCLFYGLGVTSDKKEGFHNWKKAAEHGHSASMYSLALCYLRGEGTPKDEQLSLHWMTRAALKGDCDAAFYMVVRSMRLQRLEDARDYIEVACKDETYRRELHSWLNDDCLSDDCLAIIAKHLGH